jgi:hypothetical protein
VDAADLELLFNNWLATDYGDCDGAELTHDGLVNEHDLKAFPQSWLTGF